MVEAAERTIPLRALSGIPLPHCRRRRGALRLDPLSGGADAQQIEDVDQTDGRPALDHDQRALLPRLDDFERFRHQHLGRDGERRRRHHRLDRTAQQRAAHVPADVAVRDDPGEVAPRVDHDRQPKLFSRRITSASAIRGAD